VSLENLTVGATFLPFAEACVADSEVATATLVVAMVESVA